ncbi:hypothetical protein PSTG_10417 [Puccinia striiformis f. sp. tritici PST-78]|uniref:No apical meristem-associated C-terminal domain-containing protein n=1 Tax=Puccinia striiformis f. sp. tritici PST-78 TaxID=1165861 RepID=A0A0L0VAJ0_9BASI|nr:hypothetical protein PSTG_10417 [Puccinia striiformis f. sp. tritici PST-78]
MTRTKKQDKRPAATVNISSEDDRWLAQHWISSPNNKSIHAHLCLPHSEQVLAHFHKKYGRRITKKQLKKRFTKICEDSLYFSLLFNKRKIRLGNSIPDTQLINATEKEFIDQRNSAFIFKSPWSILRHHPRWMEIRSEEDRPANSSQQQSPSTVTPKRSSQRIASQSTKHYSTTTYPPSIPSESEYQPSSDYHLSDIGSPDQRHRRRPSPPRSTTSTVTQHNQNPVQSPITQEPQYGFNPVCRSFARIEQPQRCPSPDSSSSSSESIIFIDPPSATQSKPSRIVNDCTTHNKSSTRKRTYEDVDHNHEHVEIKPRYQSSHRQIKPSSSSQITSNTPSTTPSTSTSTSNSAVTSTATTTEEQNRINLLQLEVKKLEALTEYERVQLDIMEKDLSCCTDQYQKEFFMDTSDGGSGWWAGRLLRDLLEGIVAETVVKSGSTTTLLSAKSNVSSTFDPYQYHSEIGHVSNNHHKINDRKGTAHTTNFIGGKPKTWLRIPQSSSLSRSSSITNNHHRHTGKSSYTGNHNTNNHHQHQRDIIGLSLMDEREESTTIPEYSKRKNDRLEQKNLSS